MENNYFQTKVVPKLQQTLKLKNSLAYPKLTKIVFNVGVKGALEDKKNIEKISQVLAQITGQKPKVTRAKKSIATFKLREGDLIGLVVTLRGKRMYSFFDKLVRIVMPRIRDFHGVRRGSFDGRGNYTLGFTEYSVFPEVDIGSIDRLQGLEITIATNAKDDKTGFILFEALGMPFEKLKTQNLKLKT